MDKELISILVCPACNGELIFNSAQQELICLFDSLAYKIEHGVANMLIDKARELTIEEKDAYHRHSKKKEKSR